VRRRVRAEELDVRAAVGSAGGHEADVELIVQPAADEVRWSALSGQFLAQRLQQCQLGARRWKRLVVGREITHRMPEKA
jgi:hypothetical protein